jgi:hemerythrin-like domain-containing protein
MQDILTRLRLDHQRLAKVLDELETAANNVSDDPGRSDLLFCLVDYLSEYPHEIHHPTEDLVFAELLQKSLTPEQRQIVEGNARQHEELERHTAGLIDFVDRANFANNETLHEYVRMQRQHMAYEESTVFQVADDVFSEEDWDTVAAHHERLHDPLFDAAEHQFAALYGCLGIEPEKIRARGADATLRFFNATRGGS